MINNHQQRPLIIVTLLFLLLLAYGFWQVFLPVAVAGSANQQAVQPANWEDVEPFFDGIIREQLAEHHVSGATVALVKDGEIWFAKGYGEANVAGQVPVTADKTLFRIASVTKLFTWTAVMQLVEQGKLDLDTDVNTYLDFTIPATYDEPITLRHLMSHSAGFEERTLGIFVASPEQLVPAAQWLPDNLPARVRPVGTASSYSNYGAALAGYIIERVSGMAYETYIETNILQPLGMMNTSTRQPLPPTLAGDLSAGYTYGDGLFMAQPEEVLQTAPGGSMSATATDMAAFMIAHLQNGRNGDHRILAETTAQQMHSYLFQHDPRLHSGYAYGFEARERNGQILLSHSGDFQYFRSRLDLLPAQNLGLFVAYNSQMSDNLPEQLLQAFLDAYYPFTPESVSPHAFSQEATSFTGVYRSNRHSYATAEKMLLLVQPLFTIRVEGDELILTHPYRHEEQRFVEVAPLLFQQLDGVERLAFREDKNGQIELAFIESLPAMALEKLSWYETAVFNQALLGFILLLFLSLFLVGLANLVRHYLQPGQVMVYPRLARAAHWTMVAVVGLSWLFLVLTAVATTRLIASLGADLISLRLLNGLIWLPWLIAILTAVSVLLLVPVWRERYWQLVERIYHTLLVMAGVAFIWFLVFWNLLGSA